MTITKQDFYEGAALNLVAQTAKSRALLTALHSIF